MSAFHAKSNLKLTIRERGKIVGRREGHNIWLDMGRALLANLVSYSSFSPLTPAEDNRLRYMGFGIGGNRQQMSSASSPPMSTHYPGTNTQTDYNRHATRLERPVRFSSSGAAAVPTGTYPSLVYAGTDVFLREFDSPQVVVSNVSRKFSCNVNTGDISYDVFSIVPLSEIGLFSNASSVNDYASAPAAYDTFDPIGKTSMFEIAIDWSIRF